MIPKSKSNKEPTFCGVPLSCLDGWEVQSAMLDGVVSSKLQKQMDDYWEEVERVKHMSNDPVTLDTVKINSKPSAETTPDDPSKIGTGAIKYDGGKASVYQGLINYFPRACMAIADISTFGASKYAWDGWADVENGFKRYKDAQHRHALYAAKGEEIDPDSNRLHLAHEAWNAVATLELYLRTRDVS